MAGNYSETFGSFVRNSNYPLEAEYIFNNVDELNEWSELNQLFLHDGLLKIVKETITVSEHRKEPYEKEVQTLYWCYNNKFYPLCDTDSFENLEKLKTFIEQCKSIEHFMHDLERRMKDKIKSVQEELDHTQRGVGLNGDGSFDTINVEDTRYLIGARSILACLKKLDSAISEKEMEAFIESAKYDSDSESLIFVFKTKQEGKKELSINVSQLIREWVPNNNPDKPIKLIRDVDYTGGPDKLSAELKINGDDDNLLKIVNNGFLKVKATTDKITHNGQNLDKYLETLKGSKSKIFDYYSEAENADLEVGDIVLIKNDESTDGTQSENTYKLVDNIKQVKDSYKYLVVYQDKAMAEISDNGNYRNYSEIIINNKFIILEKNSNVQPITLHLINGNDYSLEVENNQYLTGDFSDTANNLGNSDTASSKWNFAINGDGTFQITTSNIAGTTKYLRYNPSTPRFSCYRSNSSTMKDPNLYVQDIIEGELHKKGLYVVTEEGLELLPTEDWILEQIASAQLEGKPGKDGVDGQDGTDGKDGQDGAPGKDGTNGKDGVSCTHSWEGTTLTITSASGTSSADLQGPQGNPGDPGLPAKIQIGTVTTGTTAAANVRSINTSTNTYALDLTIPKGSDGINGNDGKDAGFGIITATIDNTVGTPNVTVTPSGTNQAKNLTFNFTGLKGEKGEKGDAGTGISLKSSQEECSEVGDAYLTEEGHIMIWNGSDFTDGGQIKGPQGPQGEPGDNGKTWKPFVSESGDLSWVEDSTSTIPTTVNIKGPQGDTPRITVSDDGYLTVDGIKQTDVSLIGPKGDNAINDIVQETGDSETSVMSQNAVTNELYIKDIPEGFVDLGLPSGTLWSIQDVEGKYGYSSVDRACEKYNDVCTIPSDEQWEELLAYTNITEDPSESKQLKFSSKNNNNFIKLDLTINGDVAMSKTSQMYIKFARFTKPASTNAQYAPVFGSYVGKDYDEIEEFIETFGRVLIPINTACVVRTVIDPEKVSLKPKYITESKVKETYLPTSVMNTSGENSIMNTWPWWNNIWDAIKDLNKVFCFELHDETLLTETCSEDLVQSLLKNKLTTKLYLKVFRTFSQCVYVPLNLIEFSPVPNDPVEFYFYATFEGMAYTMLINTEDLSVTITADPIEDEFSAILTDTINSWFNNNNEE